MDQSKIFAGQMIYKHMKPFLEKHQSKNIMDYFSGFGEMTKTLYQNHPMFINDHMYHCCLITESQLIYYPEIKRRIELLNQVQPREGLLTQRFGLGERCFLPLSTCMKLDGIRIQIEEWYQQYLISRNQYIKLLGIFLYCVDYYLNNLIFSSNNDEQPVPFTIQNLFDLEEKPSKYYIISNEEALRVNFEKYYEMIQFTTDHLFPPVKVESLYLNLVHQRSKYSFFLETLARYDDSQIKEEIFNKNRMKELAKKFENIPLLFIRYNGGLKDMKIARVFEDLGRNVEVIKIDMGRKKNQKSVIEEFLLVVE